MRRRYLIATVVVGAALAPGMAVAQMGMSAPGSQPLLTRAPSATETGLKLGEDLTVHVGAGTEVGYDSNVYYQDSNNQPQSSSIMRVLGFAELTNASHGDVPSGLYFDLVANLVYRQYFSDNVQPSDVRSAFMPTVGGYLELSSGQQVGLAAGDSFTRSEEPPYNPGGGPIVRDTNTGSLQVRWSPGGGRLQGLVRYTNVLDIFEDTTTGSDFSYANSMSHEIMLDGSWRWFPKTALFLNARQGYVSYLNSDAEARGKVPSYPLHVTVGLRGLITEKTSVNIGVGYANGFYSSGPPVSGFGNLYASVDFSYRPIQTTNISLGYQHDFQNSLLGNYYTLDGVRGAIQQMLAGRLSLGAFALYQNRRFSNADVAVPTRARTDNFFQAGASLDFRIKSWGYLGAVYSLYTNSSNAVGAMVAGAPVGTASYTKHQVLGRIGVVF